MDKREIINFYQINTGMKLRELSGTVIASTIVTYYMLTNIGDRIGFIDDTNYILNVCGEYYKPEYFDGFTDVTDRIVENLIRDEIIKDNGIIWVNKEDNLFVKDLLNIWDTKAKL